MIIKCTKVIETEALRSLYHVLPIKRRDQCVKGSTLESLGRTNWWNNLQSEVAN